MMINVQELLAPDTPDMHGNAEPMRPPSEYSSVSHLNIDLQLQRLGDATRDPATDARFVPQHSAIAPAFLVQRS
jgi:hypothetical protein